MGTTLSVRRDLSRRAADVMLLMAAETHWVERARLARPMVTTLAEVVASEDEVTATTTSVIPLDWLPSALRGLAQAPPVVHRIERWRRRGERLEGVMTFTFRGIDATAAGSGLVSPVDGGSTIEVTIDIAVHIPFVGGTVERLVAAQLEGMLRRELALLD